MNKYKLTYVVDEGTTEDAYVTGRSEAEARKTLKGQIGSRSIVDIELIDTDVQATKEQELEAVRQIREIVELMGPGSYIATALDGWSDAAAYGRRRLSQPHQSDRKRKGVRAKAKCRTRIKRRRK